jgi:ubiquinone biosynthesis protein
MVGALDAELRDRLGRLMVALVRGNPDRLAAALVELGAATPLVDRGRMRDDLEELLARHSGGDPGDLDFSSVSGEMLEIARRHRLRPPRDLALLLKAFVMEEGMAKQLDPEFRLVEELTPYVYRHLAAQLSPAALARRAGQVGVDLAELALDFPDQLHRILELAASGGLDVHLRTAELEQTAKRLERLGNRIVVAVLAAAVLDALAELYATRTRPHGRGGPRPSTALAGVGKLARDLARKRRRGRIR